MDKESIRPIIVGFCPYHGSWKMNKAEVIQKLLDKKRALNYLEIGVAGGNNFFPIKVKRKIAVDPNFTYPAMRKIKWALKNPYNILAKYYKLTSDNYFANAKGSHQLDVVFIDGLHTYQQSLKDVNNSLSNLRENGVIVVHDCNPPNEAAAYPADSLNHAISLNLPGWTGEWCGDVWKTICYLRSSRKDLRIFVLDCDYGLGVITRGEANGCLNLSEKNIAEMTYADLARNRKQLLNLMDQSYLSEFLINI